nr:TMV resistance protein N-like [Quercus suber]
MATQTASSSTWKYDVFLSFCGVDTRKNFTDHLYAALKQKGIVTFRDDEKLERGKYISTELLKAIKESKYAIIVLSRNYASSRWCLIELAKIVECMKDIGLIVLPVFYHVDPSHVRNQTGILAEAFAKHEKDPKINIKDVQAWKDALKEVGNISGWHVNDSHESSDIQQILKRIFSELNFKFSSIFPKGLVGIDSRVKEVLDSYLDEGSGGVCFVGICGMGGMGKTTLAQEIYKRIFVNFEASSFIDNVREETKNRGLVSLQKQLISKILMESETNIWKISEGINVIGNIVRNKKVLIVLDDVDGEEQLEALAGNHDWFGSGSRIIVTSRDSHLLRRCDMNFIYTIKELNNDDALKLFSWRAFKKPDPKENYMDLSQDFVNYANGLPLALKVLGSLLFDKEIDEWIGALDKLKVEPDKKILDILKISYDGLTNTQKELFLDIACFFKGENKDCIRDILKSFGYYPEYNIGVLIDKSLITIEPKETIWMHDLLQEMGQEIVSQESPKELGGRRRLLHYEDVLFVLKNNIGTEVVEGIKLNMPIEIKEHLNAEAFSKMKKLRLLKIGYEQPPRDLIRGPVQLPQGLSYISNELRAIDWHGYPLKSMPTSFQPNKLVELRMHYSGIKQLWKGIMVLNELKLIDLSDSQNLIEIPDLSGVPNLKQLILQRCTRLYKIHASLGDLKRLIRLDLNGCKCLESLPHKISLEALEFFNLSGCSKLKKFPDIAENMPRLSKLCLSETTIKDLSLLVIHSTSLIELDLRDCKNLSSLPIAICSLMSLKTLNLSGCSKLDELPKNLGKIEGLEELDLSGTAITSLPSSIIHLKNLKVLSLSRCVGLSSNKLTRFPLMQLRRSPDPTGMLERSLIGLCSLIKLDLSYCNVQTIPNVLGCLSSLIRLHLRGNNFVSLPESIIQLSNLRDLSIGGCAHLRMLPKLPLNIGFINARNCTSLETLSLRPESHFRPDFDLLGCNKLIKNQDYGDLFSTMLRHYLINTQGLHNYTFHHLIPGSEIPKWFSHQNVGISVNLQVPSDLLGNKWMGIAVCAVFVFRKHHPLHQLHIQDYGDMIGTHYLGCSIAGSRVGGRLILSEEFGKIESYQLYLYYYPVPYFGVDWKTILNQVDSNGFSQIEVKFEPEGPGLEVTKCGAHLVSERDIEDLINQTKAGPSSCIITPYDEDGFEDSEIDAKIKLSSDDSNGEGAGPSGEATSNDEPPHLYLIENWFGNSDCEEEESQ